MAERPRLPRDDSGRDAKSKFLKLARDRFKQAEDNDKPQLKREQDDLRFYAGEQWPEDILNSRKGSSIGAGDSAILVPARPCITIVGKVRKPVKQVLNQERGADMGIEIIPADDFGDLAQPIADTEIELREGLTRRIQRDSKASDARTWAFSRATIAGRGYYIVLTRYVPGKTNDQEVYIHRIYNQAGVLGDPAREQPDGSDAEWWFIGTDVPWHRYKAEHPRRANGKKNRVAGCTDQEWRTFTEEQPDWFEGEGEMRSVRVVDYFYTDYEPRDVVTYRSPDETQERTEWADEMPDPPEGWTEFERHTDLQKTIKFAKIDGCDDDVLEETDWAGPDMPVVQVLGEELHPYDKERRAEGMVRPLREPCQGNNAMISKFVEMVAMTPMPTLMMAAGQQEGFEDWYQAATTRTLPYLLYNQKDLNDQLAPQPFAPPNRDMPIAPVATGLQMFSEAIQDSSISDPALGQTDSTVKSAKHANILREEAAQGSSNYLDNLKRSMEYEAKIINNLLYPIYGRRPGRLARLVNGEGDPKDVIVGKPMVMQNGRPAIAPPEAQNAQTYALTPEARFSTAVKISKNFDTRRQQEASTIGELLSSAPALMTWFGDLFFKNQDGPGHTEMAERAKVMLDPKIQQAIAAKAQGGGPPSPELQAAQQQIQQLTQVAQQLQQQLQTDAVKEQAETQRTAAELASKEKIAQLQAQLDLQKAQMDNAARIEIARIGQEKVIMQARLEADEEAQARGHEVGMALMTGTQQAQGADAERAHASASADADRQHQAEQAAAGQQAQSAEAEAARQHEAEMQAQQQQAAADQAAQQGAQG